MLDRYRRLIVLYHLLINIKESFFLANNRPWAPILHIYSCLLRHIVASTRILQSGRPMEVHDAVCAALVDVGRFQRPGHLLKHNLSLGEFLILAGALVEVQGQLLHGSRLSLRRSRLIFLFHGE